MSFLASRSGVQVLGDFELNISIKLTNPVVEPKPFNGTTRSITGKASLNSSEDIPKTLFFEVDVETSVVQAIEPVKP
jgi:hypothetical protein